MKKIIAIAFSDLHINDWSKHNKDNSRTLNHFRVLSIMGDLCKKYDCPALFCGDLFHQPEKISLELHSLVIKEFLKISDSHNFDNNQRKLYCISGNHDTPFISTIGDIPRSWVNEFSIFYWLESLDYKSIWVGTNIIIHGVPYIDHNIGLNDYLKNLKLEKGCKHILLLHTDYPGAEDTDGRRVDSVENLNLNILNRFDLVLCGHIHKPQRLSKKVYMIGAPLQQRRTDKNCKLGYWEIYEDLTLKFKELKGFPKFIDVESEEDVKDDGNYYTIIPKPKASENVITDHKISKQLSKRKLAKTYMKQKGIKDPNKEKLLIDILKKSEE